MQVTRGLFLPSDLVGSHSLPPVLFLLTILVDIFRGDISGVATCMIHSGLAFILTIYCMHLLYVGSLAKRQKLKIVRINKQTETLNQK